MSKINFERCLTFIFQPNDGLSCLRFSSETRLKRAKLCFCARGLRGVAGQLLPGLVAFNPQLLKSYHFFESRFGIHRHSPSCFAHKGTLRKAHKTNSWRKPGFPLGAAPAPISDFQRPYAPAPRRVFAALGRALPRLR